MANVKKRTFKGELLIPEGSVLEQLVNDFIEDGFGQKATKFFVNKLLREEENQPLSLAL